MKKLILFAAILFAGVSVVKAAGPVLQEGVGSAKLTVNLYPIQYLSFEGDVTLDYKDYSDYSNAEGVTKGGTVLTVNSVGGFTIRVAATALKMGEKVIPLDKIKVAATLQDGAIGTPVTTTLVEGIASTKGNELLYSDKGGMDMKYNVAYTGAGNRDFLKIFNENEVVLGETQTYTSTVYYTIEPK